MLYCSNIQNLLISFVKFIPLLIAAFIGYAFVAMNGTGGIETSPGVPTPPDVLLKKQEH